MWGRWGRWGRGDGDESTSFLRASVPHLCSISIPKRETWSNAAGAGLGLKLVSFQLTKSSRMYAVLLHLRIKARLPSVIAKCYTWSNLGDETIKVWSVRHYLRPQMPWLLSDRVASSLNVVSQTCKIGKESKLGWNQWMLKLCMSHSQMLGKFEYTLPAKFWRLVGCTEMLSW